MRKSAIFAFLFWVVYLEVIFNLANMFLERPWWSVQLVILLVSLMMVALTSGSQTKDD
jgi:hypothetical protein